RFGSAKRSIPSLVLARQRHGCELYTDGARIALATAPRRVAASAEMDVDMITSRCGWPRP
ncbi:MAG TPA: hypothetical protein VGH99_02645, partial [Pseudonocardia sp.]